MRLLTLLLCLVLYGPAAALAAVAAPAAQTASTPSYMPHRALYALSLASAKSGSDIVGVSGTMAFEWRDVCDGWTIQQRSQLHFAYNDGEEQTIGTSELTWEAKDGRSFNFNIKRTVDGEPSATYRGKAKIDENGKGSAHYTIPEKRTVELPAGTVFPTSHTGHIIRAAAQNQPFFSAHVFDGADETGASDVSVFSRPQRALTKENKLKKNAALSDNAIPARLAFFTGGETGTPDYEMDVDLQDNGVVRAMRIDYGDFVIKGVLEDVEPLSAPQCK